jgi:hypothetical protein
MDRPLPPILDRYFKAENAGDVEALAACFEPDGTVVDEGRSFLGAEAIAAWMREARAKYHHLHVEPLEMDEHTGGPIVVRGSVSGDFDGSPVVLAHAFQLRGGRICRLEIRA